MHSNSGPLTQGAELKILITPSHHQLVSSGQHPNSLLHSLLVCFERAESFVRHQRLCGWEVYGSPLAVMDVLGHGLVAPHTIMVSITHGLHLLCRGLDTEPACLSQ